MIVDIFGRRGNLLQNPGFEGGLTAWEALNVTLDNTTAAEGAIAARMEKGISSLFQDVLLNPISLSPLFLSFIVYEQDDYVYNSQLIVEVLWLDARQNVIGTGLRAFLGRNIIANARITYFDSTDKPPLGTHWARLQLSKGDENSGFINFDQFSLIEIETPNLVQNPSFDSGLENWSSQNFTTNFTYPWEGNAVAYNTCVSGTLFQDVPINPVRPFASYLLSFAAEGIKIAGVSVQLIWLGAAGNPIGTPGIDLPINPSVLPQQGNYLSYLAPSSPAPLGAVTARIQFTTDILESCAALRIDKVILVRITSGNLVQNPGFVNGLDNWTSRNVIDIIDTAYVGTHFALFAREGALLYQIVDLPRASLNHYFLFSFALLHTNTTLNYGNIQARVLWLDSRGNELGEAASVLAPPFPSTQTQWLVYETVTERAPQGSAAVKIQFTKSEGFTIAPVGIDHVLFARVN